MLRIRNRLIRLASGVEANFDALALAFRKRLDADKPVQIVTYRTYGTRNRLFAKGRVLRDKTIRKATEKDTILNNLLSMYKRFESDEIPGARLKVEFHGLLET